MIYENTKCKCNSPKVIPPIIRELLKAENEIDQDKEHFWSVGLTTNNNIKYIELVSLGILNASIVHPREVYRLAVMKAVAGVIVVHNHPSGNAKPSPEDRKVTKQLVKAGEILSIPIIDHIIIAEDEYYSFVENGNLS